MVCMNFLAMPRLKKERPVVALFISMMRFFALNSTFESARTGIWNSGSFFFLAASRTTSARPTSRSSTLSFAMALLLLRGHLLDRFVLRRDLGDRRGGLVGGFDPRRRRDRAHDAFRRHDDRRLAGGFLRLVLLLEDLVGLVAPGDLLGDRRQLLHQLRVVELPLLQALAGGGDLLDVGLEDVAALQLEGGPVALADERRKAPSGLVQGEAD